MNKLYYIPEVWRDIKEYEGFYQVSNLGRVRSLDRVVLQKNGVLKAIKGKILSPSKCGKLEYGGYLFVGLSKDSVVKDHYIHRLVAEAFIPNPYNLPYINHKDENKLNNFVYVNPDGTVDFEKSNLEWCTALHNLTFNERHIKVGLKLKGRIPLTRKEVVMYKDGVEIKRFAHPQEAADYLEVSESCVRNCIYGKIHFLKGYTFEYADGSGRWSDERIREKMNKDNERRKNKRKKMKENV